MLQQGQVFELATRGPDGKRLWAYRYRAGGRDSKRVQRGGFRRWLQRELPAIHRRNGGWPVAPDTARDDDERARVGIHRAVRR
jgi:hypothetical protein